MKNKGGMIKTVFTANTRAGVIDDEKKGQQHVVLVI